MNKPTPHWLDWIFANPPTVVFYHQNCSDGLMSAVTHMRAYEAHTHHAVKSEYIGIPAGQGLDRLLPILQRTGTGSIIHMVDVSTHPEEFNESFGSLFTLLMFDHHSKPVADWHEYFRQPDFVEDPPTPGAHIYYDITKSGAGIVADLMGERTELVDLVEDRDLWLFKYPLTELCGETLGLLQPDPHVWNDILPRSGVYADIPEKYRKAGKNRLEHRHRFIDKWIAQHPTYRVKLKDTEVRAIEAPTRWHSETAHEMLKRRPELPIALIYPADKDKQTVTLSLRSTDGTYTTAEQVGQQFPGQGGGHVSAYGIRLRRNQIPDVLWRAAENLNQSEYEKSN